MRQSSRPLGLLAAALLVSGCSSYPAAPAEDAMSALAGTPPDMSRLIGVDAGTLARAGGPDEAARLGEIRGRVLAPPGMVAAGGMNMVAAGGLNLAPDAGGMVAAGGLNEGAVGRPAGFALLAVAPAPRPVAGAEVQALDPAGHALPGVAPATTDAEGRFHLRGVPQGAVVVLTARLATRAGAARTFEAVVRLEGPAAEADLSVASTVAAGVARRGPLAAVRPADVRAALDAARAALPPARAAEIAERGAFAEAAAAVEADAPRPTGPADGPRPGATPAAAGDRDRDDARRGSSGPAGVEDAPKPKAEPQPKDEPKPKEGSNAKPGDGGSQGKGKG